MYLEDNKENDPGYTDILNEKANQFLINEELKHNISTQFNFENIGYNYFNDYNPSLEVIDWFLTYINENYFVIDNLINIYEQVDRLKFISYTIYEFLFVNILEVLPKLNLENSFKFELNSYLTDALNSLITIKEELKQSNIETSNLDTEILKYSTLITLFDTNFKNFENNYVNIVKTKFIN